MSPSGQIRKQGTFNLASVYLGIVLGALNTVVLYPRAFLGREDEWGLIQLLLAYGLVLSSFANLGIGRSLVRFIPYFPAERNALIAFAGKVSLFGLGLTVALLVIGQDYWLELIDAPPLFRRYGHLLLPLLALLMLADLLTGMFQGMIRTRLPQFVTEVGLRLGVSVLLLVHLFTPLTFPLFLLLFFALYLLRVLLLVFIYFRDYAWEARARLSPKRRSELLKFGFIALFSSSTAMVLTKVDQIFIGRYLSLADLTVYSIPSFIAGVIQAPARSIAPVGMPALSKAWANRQLASIESIYRKSALIQMLLSGGVFFLAFFVLDGLYYFLPAHYQAGKEVFLLLGLSRVGGSMFGVNAMVLMTSRLYRINLFFNLLLIAGTIWLNWLLVPAYGLNGAALAVLLNIVGINLLRVVFVYFRFGFSPFDRNTLLALLVLLLPAALAYLLPLRLGFWEEMILRSLVFGAFYLFLLWILRPSEDIHALLRRLVHRG